MSDATKCVGGWVYKLMTIYAAYFAYTIELICLAPPLDQTESAMADLAGRTTEN